jgi:hypothetical protein
MLLKIELKLNLVFLFIVKFLLGTGLVEALCLTEDKIVFQKLFPYFANSLMLQDTIPAHIIPRVMLHVRD